MGRAGKFAGRGEPSAFHVSNQCPDAFKGALIWEWRKICGSHPCLKCLPEI